MDTFSLHVKITNVYGIGEIALKNSPVDDTKDKTKQKTPKSSYLNLESSKVQSAFSFLIFSMIKNSLVILKDFGLVAFHDNAFYRVMCGKCNFMLSQNIKQ